MEAGSAASGGLGWRLWALVPLLLLAVAVALVVSHGDRVVDLVGGSPPPADEFDVRRVEFREGEIRILVRNPQRDDLTIASSPSTTRSSRSRSTGPRRSGGSARARSSSRTSGSRTTRSRSGSRARRGSRRPRRCPPRGLTPEPDVHGFLGYGLIGVLVGVVPVALGLLWLPSLRRARPEWLAAFMALTAGLLTFLGVEALFEALRAPGHAAGGVRRPRSRPARARGERARDDVPLLAPLAREARASPGSRSRCSSRSGSASTTSARGSRSGRPSRPASSSSARSS